MGKTPATNVSAGPTWLNWFVPGIILLLAAALRSAGIDKSIWLDEASSYAQANADDFIAMARHDGHPPLYFALLRFGLHFTHSFTLLRLFSVACGLGTITLACFFFRGRHRYAGWCAALLLATSPGFISNAQEMRQYALLTLALIAALFFTVRVVESPQNSRAVIGLALALAIAACTHLITAFFLAALWPVMTWQLRHESWATRRRATAAFIPALGLILFFKSVFLLRTTQFTEHWWMPPISGELLGQVFGEITGANALRWLADAFARHLTGSGPVFLLLVSLATAVVLWTAFGRAATGVARSFLAVGIIYWSLLIGYSLVIVPLVWPRTMLPGMLPVLIGIGFGVSQHPHARQRLFACAAAIGLAALTTVPWVHALAYQPTEDLRGLTACLKSNLQPTDLPVYVGGVEWGLATYWADCEVPGTIKIDVLEPASVALAKMQPALAQLPLSRSVFVVYREDLYLAQNHRVLDDMTKLIALRGSVATELWNRDYYHIVRFSPPPL